MPPPLHSYNTALSNLLIASQLGGKSPEPLTRLVVLGFAEVL